MWPDFHFLTMVEKVYKKYEILTLPGSPPKLRQFGFWKISAYTEATWSSKMSYERKFCGLFEYVRFQNVRPQIKSTHSFKQEMVDFAYADLK